MPRDAHFDELIAANEVFAERYRTHPHGPRPARRLAVVTCMDTRIDALAMLGLAIGDAHVLRNAGARITPDVLRSLAVSVHVLGVRYVAVVQHTDCGMASATEEQLRERVGADLDYLTIDDHDGAVRRDMQQLWEAPYLSDLRAIGGFVFDVETGSLRAVHTFERQPEDAAS